jgi:cysteinyl-tRNA synthetase
MQIQLSNTLGREKQRFEPIDPQKVTMYSCGPTVYSTQHLGNLRAVFVVDLLRRVLTHVGKYEVQHIMNITDVGHLTDDGDHGEDKMEKGARKDGITARDVAKKYTDIFLEDARYMGVSIGTERGESAIYMPRATDHIHQQIDMIVDLEAK